LQRLGEGAVAAIKGVSGTVYASGTICKKYGKVIGDTVDYVHDVSKSKHTFTIELRDKGRFGFVLPPDQILPTATEDFAGLKYLLRNMR
jgi:carboxypeptidase A4